MTGTTTTKSLATGTQRPTDVRLPWVLAWFGAPILAIANGAIRELVYKPYTGERSAQIISTALLLAILALYMRTLDRRWPLPSAMSAIGVGLVWLALTIAFEFGFGRYVEGNSWEQLFAQYDVTRGSAWILVPLWTAIGPAVVRGLRRRHE